MRIGILVASIGSFGQKGFYNLQEVGLARGLDALCEEVIVYKAVPSRQNRTEEPIRGSRNSRIIYIPTRKIGNNGLFDIKNLDATLDAVIFFSDMQPLVPKVCRWGDTNRVKIIPYIGVTESHSTNKIVRTIMNSLFFRNIRAYRQRLCFAKTPSVKEKLRSFGVENVEVIPVGLDTSLLHDGSGVRSSALKAKYGFADGDKIILFIGRMIDEKQPLRMIDIFSELCKIDRNYRLLMVGTGPFSDAVDQSIAENQVQDLVTRVPGIPNSEIWELYTMADCFVNLNQQEIFGMAILEALYYGCKVAAWDAPGPRLITDDGKYAGLVSSDQQTVDYIRSGEFNPEASRRRIMDSFTWASSARLIFALINS